MATTTTNLGLTKPAGSDKIRIAQINGNMDIIDEKVGAVGNTSLQDQISSANEAIGNLRFATNLGSISTSSALETAIETAAQSLEQYECRPVSFYAGASFSGFVNGSRYQGIVNVVSKSSSATYLSVIFESSKADLPVIGNYANGTWSWRNFMFVAHLGTAQSDITNIDNVPLNASGKLVLGASVSPTGTQISGSYIKLGEDNNNYSVYFIRQYTNVMYIYSKAGGTVKGWQELAPKSYVTTITYNNRVDISSYTSTQYTTPKDGYLNIINGSGKTGLAEIALDAATYNFTIGGAVGRFAVFLRAGSKIKITGATDGAMFYPIG